MADKPRLYPRHRRYLNRNFESRKALAGAIHSVCSASEQIGKFRAHGIRDSERFYPPLKFCLSLKNTVAGFLDVL
ncbi:hypothetical protein OQJ46_16940, partial [Microbulbifer thermotolerans]|uniref:hypothetical protein n=1 Tax=Microbulbifer thermotolerans TaxID=252514 RepID=UPI00224AF8D4